MKSYTNQSQFDEDKIEALVQNAIDPFESRLSSTEYEILDIQNGYTTLTGLVAGLSSEVTAENENVSSLLNRMTLAESKITTIQGEISGLTTEVTSIQSELNNLSNLQNDVNANFTYNKNQVELLSTVLLSLLTSFGIQLGHLEEALSLFTTEYMNWIVMGPAGNELATAVNAWSYPTGSRYLDLSFGGVFQNNDTYKKLLELRQNCGVYPSTSAYDIITNLKIKQQAYGNTLINGVNNTPVPLKININRYKDGPINIWYPLA